MMRLFGGQYIAGNLVETGETLGGKTGRLMSGIGQVLQEGLMTGAAAKMMTSKSPYAAAVAIGMIIIKIS